MVAFDSEVQVLVVGSGPGGLALAAFLRRAGLEPVVVDPAEPASERGRGVRELAPVALSLLADLDVADAVREAGTPVRSWSLRDPDGTTVERFEAPGEEGAGATGGPGFVAVGASALRAAVREALPGDAVRTGTGPVALDRGPVGLTVEFANGVREPFDVVVGADGVRSRTRDLVDDPDRTVLGATAGPLALDPVDPLEGARETWLSEGVVVRGFPADAGPRGWVTVLADDGDGGDSDDDALVGPPDVPDPVEVLAGVEWLADAEWPADAERLAGERATERDPDAGWTADVSVGTDRWAGGRVAFLGAAARGRHPLAGLDPTLAVEDAAVLAAELVGRDDAVPDRLADYAGRRRSRYRRLVHEADPAPWFVETDSSLPDPLRSVLAVRSAGMARWFDGDRPDPSVGVPPTR